MLRNLELVNDRVGNIKPGEYCKINGTNIMVLPIAAKQGRYTPDKYLELEAPNYAFVDDGSQLSLAAYGEHDLCGRAKFTYNLIAKNNNSMIFNAVTRTEMQWFWFEYYLQFSGCLLYTSPSPRDS